MFSGLWAKITAVLSAAVGILVILLKWKSKQVHDLEKQVGAHQKKEEIREEVKEGGKKIDQKAEEQKNELDKEADDWRNRI